MTDPTTDFTNAEYSRWMTSADWLQIVRPWLESRQHTALLELRTVDASDSIAVATIQGRIYEIERIMEAPEQYFDNFERERLLNAQDEEKLDDGRAKNRLISYGRR